MDKKGKKQVLLGEWDKAELFDSDGFAKTIEKINDSTEINYLLDTTGQKYRVAYTIADIKKDTATALDLRGTRLNSFPPDEILQDTQLKVVLLNFEGFIRPSPRYTEVDHVDKPGPEPLKSDKTSILDRSS